MTKRSCITTALAVLALLSACTPEQSVAPELVAHRHAWSGGTWSPWSAPVNLGAVINTAAQEMHPALSKNGLSMYFTSDRAGSRGLDIWVAQRASESEPWGAPQNLGPLFNSDSTDMAPYLTVDGHRLYFHSGRAGGCGAFDLYVSTRHDNDDDFGWGPPVNLGCTINGPFDDAGPMFTENDGTGEATLYLNSARPGGPGGSDIYRSVRSSDGTWGPATLVTELNLPFRDTRTVISRDGLELILSSDVNGRLGGIGSQDLWVATRATIADPWSEPVNLGAGVNTTAFDGGPALSFNGTELYFLSERPGGFGRRDLYVSTRARLR